jgi:D-alanine-D-alanine ligase
MSTTEGQPSSRRVALLPTSISVLFGGPSAEHEVSLVSGRSIAGALLGRGHDVSAWLIGLDGRWWPLPPAALDPALPAAAFRDPAALGAPAPRSAAAALEELAVSRPVVFPAMHGPFGEDGQVQALLESVGLTYCGAGPAASAVGMDKTLFKRICGSLELPVLPWMEVRAPEYATDTKSVDRALAAFAAELPDARLICKPARLGSSIGITIVHHPADRAELGAAIREALRYDDLALLEPYLDHPRELETSVLGNWRADTRAYGPGEVVPSREFYDYVAKYVSDDSQTLTHADLEPGLAADIRAAAVEVFLAIGACGYARVDMLLSPDGIPFISEINTIPGFTPISLFPRMTAQGGYDFGDTCERIVELALERAESRPTDPPLGTGRP